MTTISDTSPCFSCDGFCCRHNVVPLTDADVRRLIDESGNTIDQVIDFVSVEDLESTHHDISFGNGYQYMVLKRRDGCCVFFDGEKRGGFCSIHSSKPMLCRIYPFFLAPFGEVILRYRNMCKTDWKMTKEAEEELKKMWGAYQEELENFNRFVSEWNSEKGENRAKDKKTFLAQISTKE
ncbi:MAG: YkgJ family cysteine cluster protein [Candidatus Altiarchaeota archaeon]